MNRPALYRAKVDNKAPSTAKVTRLQLSYVDPSEMHFEPGKFVNLKCPNGKYRAYSIASDYKNTKALELLIETGHNGLGSNYVRSLKLQDEVEIIGPSGKFFLRDLLPMHLVFFATGTGIAPFYAMFHKLIDLKYVGKVEVYFGNRTKELIIEPQLLDYFSNQLADFTVIHYLSQEVDVPITEPNVKAGRVTQALDECDDFSAQYYICGHPDMVDYVSNFLSQKGIPQDQIIVEGFTHSQS
jgi:ferredoxin-NADP reductase